MSSPQISNLIQRIKKLKEKVDKFEISNNFDEDQNKFEQIEKEYKDLARGTEGIDEIDDNDIKGDIPLLNQFKVQKNDLDIIEGNYNEIFETKMKIFTGKNNIRKSSLYESQKNILINGTIHFNNF